MDERSHDIDVMLQDGLDDLPQDISHGVTPWRRAMNLCLAGIALNTLTLNFLLLNYILPTAGLIMMLLGFRSLRRENALFRLCFIISAVRIMFLIPSLALNATVYADVVYDSPAYYTLSVINMILLLLMFFFLRFALLEVQQKAGLPPRAKGTVALIVWYFILILLALINYKGIIIGIIMIVAYICIIRSLVNMSHTLDAAGYALNAAPVRIPGAVLVAGIVVIIAAGITCGYIFGSSYPMAWSPSDSSEHDNIADIKSHLTELGFPADILDDIAADDLAPCADAVAVVVNIEDHSVNDGRVVTTQTGNRFHSETVYDVKELHFTSVAVRLPGEWEIWRVFHHFIWTVDPDYRGTEALRINSQVQDLWMRQCEVTGRILYDENGVTYTSPYHFLGKKTYTYSSMFWGEITMTNTLASFSLPDGGSHHRGYVSFTVSAISSMGAILESSVEYMHQTSWMNYPAETAIDKFFSGYNPYDGTFKRAEAQLMFYPHDEYKE